MFPELQGVFSQTRLVLRKESLLLHKEIRRSPIWLICV
jgi:hypothetical protein